MMKLNIFNTWKSLGKLFGKDLEYQTSKLPDKDLFITYIRDKKSRNVVTRYYGKTKEQSLQSTVSFLKKLDGQDIWDAIENNTPITRIPDKASDNPVDWRDGANHRYRAQKRIVGEQLEDIEFTESEDKDTKPKINNLVAKHARKFNKSVVMRDKKNDYKRKEKYKKELKDSE